MKKTIVCVFVLMSALFVNLKIGLAQTSSTNQTVKLSERAEKIKKDFQKIGANKEATIFLPGGRVFIGVIKSIEDEQALIVEMNSKQVTELKYEEIEKVWKGIATQNAFGGWVKPKYKKFGLIAAIALVVVLPIVLVATQLD
jgi:hypothetical protein